MTPLDYGISGIIFAYVAGFEALKDLGLRVGLTNSFFKFPDRYKWVWKRILGIMHVWSVFYSIILACLIGVIIPTEAQENRSLILFFVVFPFLVLDPPISIGRYYLQYSKKPVPISIISASTGLLTVFCNYYFIVIEHWGYMGLIAGQFFAQCLSFVCYAYLVYGKLNLQPSLQFNKRWVRKQLIIALPTIPHFYAGYIINIFDRILLDWFQISIEQIGMYSFAYSFGTYFAIIGKSFQTASGPYYMEHNREENLSGDQKNKRLTEISQLGMLLLAFSLVLFLPEIFTLLVKNNELRQTYTISAIIIFAYTYFPMFSIIGMKQWYNESTKLMLSTTVGAAVVSIALNLLLIPIIGILGSAIATLIALLFMGYFGHFYPKIKVQFNILPKAGWWIAITSVLMVLSFCLMELNWLIKGFILFILLACTTMLFYKRNFKFA